MSHEGGVMDDTTRVSCPDCLGSGDVCLGPEAGRLAGAFGSCAFCEGTGKTTRGAIIARDEDERARRDYRTRVAEAVREMRAAGLDAAAWGTCYGFDIDTAEGIWEVATRVDGCWFARFIATGECLPTFAGSGSSARAALLACEPTSWASDEERRAGWRARIFAQLGR